MSAFGQAWRCDRLIIHLRYILSGLEAGEYIDSLLS